MRPILRVSAQFLVGRGNKIHPVAGMPSDVFLIDRSDSVPGVGRIQCQIDVLPFLKTKRDTVRSEILLSKF